MKVSLTYKHGNTYSESINGGFSSNNHNYFIAYGKDKSRLMLSRITVSETRELAYQLLAWAERREQRMQLENKA